MSCQCAARESTASVVPAPRRPAPATDHAGPLPRASGPASAARRPSSVPVGGCGCGPCSGKDGPPDAGPGPAAGGGGGGGAAAVKKTVSIFAVNVGAAMRNPAPDVARANALWSGCGVKVNYGGGICIEGQDLDLSEPKGVLNDFTDPASPTNEELALLARRKSTSSIYAFYVPSMTDHARGEALFPSASKTSAIFMSESAASDSFAHELGHILLDDGGHSADPDNLMASGTIRNVGVDHLTADQCAKASR